MSASLAQLVALHQQLKTSRSRKRKSAWLVQFLSEHRLEAGELMSYLSGRLPVGKIGVGPAAIRKALEVTEAGSGSTLSVGDLSRLAAEIKQQRGKGSAQRKHARLCQMFEWATAEERDLLARLLFGELRQGALEKTAVSALAELFEADESSLQRALMICGNLADLTRALVDSGREGLSRFQLQLFRPLRPMLASPIADLSAVEQRFVPFFVDWKLDGARMQLHRSQDRVEVYSRSLRSVGFSLPEVVEWAQRLPSADFILDGEVIALRDDGSPRPFQETMRRFGRRTDLQQMRAQLPMTPRFFDLLYLNGESLLELPFLERRRRLEELVGSAQVPGRLFGDVADAKQFVAEALAQGHEGVMLKDPEALYEAGSRGFHWLKFKPAHTLDLVVLAAEWGSGRRKGWLSNLHLGARDHESQQFVMLGKTFKGLTDEILSWQTERLLELETSRDSHTVFVEPRLVVEIAVNEIQESSIYPAGMALRFARVKAYRPEKSAIQADTLSTVRQLFLNNR